MRGRKSLWSWVSKATKHETRRVAKESKAGQADAPEEFVVVSDDTSGLSDLVLGTRHDIVGGSLRERDDDGLLNVDGQGTLGDSQSGDDGREEAHGGQGTNGDEGRDKCDGLDEYN